MTGIRSSATGGSTPPGTRRRTRATAAHSDTSTARTRVRSGISAATGMPPFGLVSDYAGSPEAHAGFKVFVANDDRKGLAWMMVLHQGSGSPKRGIVRFHSLETWLFRQSDGRMLAHTRQMADFGDAVPNCAGANPRRAWRLLPAPGCRPAYEEWDTTLDVGRRVRRAARLRHPQRDHAVRPRDPERCLQQAIDLRKRPRGVAIPLQGRPPQRAAPALVRAQPRLLAVPDRRVRPPRRRRSPAGGLEPRPRRSAARAPTGSRTPSSRSSPRTAASIARAAAFDPGAGSSSRVTA